MIYFHKKVISFVEIKALSLNLYFPFFGKEPYKQVSKNTFNLSQDMLLNFC